MKKNGHYYSKFLTENELERFKANLGDHSIVDWLFDHEFNNFHSFIGSGFYWDRSNEGHDYWANISYRKISDTFLFKQTPKHSMI